MNFKLSKVADTLVQQSVIFSCSIETAWNEYMHPIITERFTFEEVKEYIDHKVELGKTI